MPITLDKYIAYDILPRRSSQPCEHVFKGGASWALRRDTPVRVSLLCGPMKAEKRHSYGKITKQRALIYSHDEGGLMGLGSE